MPRIYICTVFILTVLSISSDAVTYPKLQMLNVVFRHGDREPNDSQKGDLTIIGRQRSYHLGKRLRARYGDFLGETYEPASLSAHSTEYVRAKMSLQLLLAGLYVPQAQQRWHNSLAWQPIPFTYATENDDIFLFPKFCPTFKKERERVESTPELKQLLEPYKDMMRNLTKLTGTEMKTSLDMFLLYHKLSAMKAMNKTLPSWSKGIFPDGLLLNGTYLEYDVLKYSNFMRKINGGALVRKMVDDMHSKTVAATSATAAPAGSKVKPSLSRKLFLYSTHELLIVALLQTLKIWQPHIPAYTSAVILELREDRGSHFVKVLYYEGIPDEFREMQIPGCLSLCPLNRFIELISDQLPTHDEMICDSKPVRYPRSVIEQSKFLSGSGNGLTDLITRNNRLTSNKLRNTHF